MTQADYDDEFLAPPIGAVTEMDETPDDADETQQWHPSHGYPDARNAVRIWVTEDTRQITKVHVSGRWREILGPNRSLEEAFGTAFLAASIRVGASPEPETPTPAVDESLTHDDFDALLERFTELDARLNELMARPADEIRWNEYAGEKTTARSGPVTVTLSWEGIAEAVRFDRTWLTEASGEQIATRVAQAARSAYARYSPPEIVPGEYEELAADLARTERELTIIMAKGLR